MPPVPIRVRTAIPMIAALVLAASTRPVAAQTDYYNLDAGRPLRVEDATPTPLHDFDLHLLPWRVERLPGGTVRWRVEPKLTYGVAPRTELEIRAPVVFRERALPPRVGLAGVGFGVLHALTIETPGLPAVAVGGELLLPYGTAAPPQVGYLAKLLATRSFRFARVHLNGVYGAYSIVTPVPQVLSPTCGPLGGPGCPPPPPIDFPCSVGVADGAGPPVDGLAGRACGGGAAVAAREHVAPVPGSTITGTHWLAGLAVDRALPLRSILLSADVFAERYEGLGRPVDVTIELGTRAQLGPRMVLDLGVGHRVAGTPRSAFATLGLTWAFAVRRLVPVP